MHFVIHFRNILLLNSHFLIVRIGILYSNLFENLLVAVFLIEHIKWDAFGFCRSSCSECLYLVTLV